MAAPAPYYSQGYTPDAYQITGYQEVTGYQDFDETSRGGIKIGGTAGAILGKIGDALKPLDPTNKNSELRKLFRDVDGIVEQILVSPYLAYYLQSLEAQLNDGRAKHLPDWLKRLIYAKYPEVNLDQVRYGENIKTLTVDPNTAVTIGYSIYFPSSINLDPNKVIRFPQDAWMLARDVHWILHELEHIVQFLKAGGSRSAWAIKYLGSIVQHANVDTNAWHDAIALERLADAKADSLLNYVLAGYSRGHPTYPFLISNHGPDKYRFELHKQQNSDFPGFLNGNFLLSPNEQFKFMIQGDGNLVVYGPGNRVVWEAQSYGRACPPFAFGASQDRTCMMLFGLTFEPRGQSLPYTWRGIWNTDPMPFDVPATGGFFLVGPETIAAAQSGLWLELTDRGSLVLYRGRLGDQPWQRKAIWSSPDASGITTMIIEPTEGTLPAVVRPRAASAPFLGYEPPPVPQFQGVNQMMY